MAKILKNTTGSPISIPDTGVTVLTSPISYTIPSQDYLLWAASIDIIPFINAGTLVLNDGVRDLVPLTALKLIQENIAFKIGFESNPERMNGFVAKNVQEAIEESRDTIQGKLSIVAFFNNGSTSNKWLVFFSSSDPSNHDPMVSLGESTITGFSYANITDNSDVDIEIYKNGVLVITWQVRNKRWAYQVGGIVSNTWGLGDRCSVFARKVTGGSGVTPNSVILRVQFQATGSSSGSGGAQNGV